MAAAMILAHVLEVSLHLLICWNIATINNTESYQEVLQANGLINMPGSGICLKCHRKIKEGYFTSSPYFPSKEAPQFAVYHRAVFF